MGDCDLTMIDWFGAKTLKSGLYMGGLNLKGKAVGMESNKWPSEITHRAILG